MEKAIETIAQYHKKNEWMNVLMNEIKSLSNCFYKMNLVPYENLNSKYIIETFEYDWLYYEGETTDNKEKVIWFYTNRLNDNIKEVDELKNEIYKLKQGFIK